MVNNHLKNKLKYLMLVSGIILLLTTIGFGLFIPNMDSEIENTQSDIDSVTTKMNLRILNIQMNSNQLVKQASTYGAYKILGELNSSYVSEFEQHLRYEIYQSIVILREEGFNSSEREYYDSLNFSELENEFKTQQKEFSNEWKLLVDQKSELEQIMFQQKENRYKFNMYIVILQVIGLTFVLIGDFLRKE